MGHKVAKVRERRWGKAAAATRAGEGPSKPERENQTGSGKAAGKVGKARGATCADSAVLGCCI